MFDDLSLEEYERIYNMAYSAPVPGHKKAGNIFRNAYFERLVSEYRAKRAKEALEALRTNGV